MRYKLAIFTISVFFLLSVITFANAHDDHSALYGVVDIVSQGEFIAMQAAKQKNLTAKGWAQMIRLPNGKTKVSIQVEGLTPDTTYPAHVHTLSCEEGAGGHYKIDTDEEDTMESNEIWPTVETDEKGVGKADIRIRHWARSEAQSIVIHDPQDKSKLFCADIFLIETQVTDNF